MSTQLEKLTEEFGERCGLYAPFCPACEIPWDQLPKL